MYRHVPRDTGLKAPSQRHLWLAQEAAARELGLRAVADIENRIDCQDDRLVLHAMSVVDAGRNFAPDETRGELVSYASCLSAANGGIMASFDSDGTVWIQDGREHCLAVLLPAIILASILFGQACYDVTWKLHLPSAYLDPDTGAFVRRWLGDERRVENVVYMVAQGVVVRM